NRLVANIMHFARILRAAGLPIGPGKVIDAVNAVRAIGVGSRSDFYWALHSVFVNRRDPKILERLLGIMLPEMDGGPPPEQMQASRRIAEAMAPKGDTPQREEE